jgi:hypothetical protein
MGRNNIAYESIIRKSSRVYPGGGGTTTSDGKLGVWYVNNFV